MTGLGTGVGFVAGADYVRSKLGTPTAQGIYGGASVGGAGLAIGLVPLAALAVDWRAPYVAGLVVAALALAVLRLAPAAAPTARGPLPVPFRDVLRDRRLYPLAILHTASFGFSVILGLWTVSLLEHDGYRTEVGGVVGSLTLILGLVTRPLGGRLMERWPDRALLLVRASMLGGAGRDGAPAARPAARACGSSGAALLGLAAGIPFAYAFTRAQATTPGRAGARDRLRERLRDVHDPRRHAARRLHLRPAGRRRDRLCRRRGAVGGRSAPAARTTRARIDLVADSHSLDTCAGEPGPPLVADSHKRRPENST